MHTNRFKLNYFLVCLLVANMLPSFAQAQAVKFDKLVFLWTGGMVDRSTNQVRHLELIINTDKSVILNQKKLSNLNDPFYSGIKIGKLTDKSFTQIMKTFTKINYDKIPLYDNGIIDGPSFSISFVDKNTVKKTFSSEEYQLPEYVWDMAYKLKDIDQLLATQTRVIKYAVDGLQNFSGIGLKNISTNEQLELSDPLHFLLWNYLRKGTVVKKTVNPVFEVITSIYQQDSLKINGTLANIVAVKTDGRYYQFEAENGQSVTIDIGFNFVENNRAYMTVALPQN